MKHRTKDNAKHLLKRIKSAGFYTLKQIDPFLQYAKLRMQAYLSRACVWLLAWGMRREWTGIPGIFRSEVVRNTYVNMRMWMIQNGIRHCSVCLLHRAELRQQGDGFRCAKHMEPGKVELLKP